MQLLIGSHFLRWPPQPTFCEEITLGYFLQQRSTLKHHNQVPTGTPIHNCSPDRKYSPKPVLLRRHIINQMPFFLSLQLYPVQPHKPVIKFDGDKQRASVTRKKERKKKKKRINTELSAWVKHDYSCNVSPLDHFSGRHRQLPRGQQNPPSINTKHMLLMPFFFFFPKAAES